MSSMTKYERLSHERKRLQSEGLAPEWLSTSGFQLLTEKSYLDTAETPLRMYTRIAKRAAELTEATLPSTWGYTNWEEAFFDVMWKGWLSPSTPVLTNMGNNRGHPIACLTGDSWIHTKHEGGTQMKNLKIGDKVLTHKGLFRKVTHKQSRMSDDDLYRLKVSTRTTPIKITGNHPVKTNKGWVRVDELDPKHHLIATNDEIPFTEVGHTLDMKNYIEYPTVLKDGFVYRAQVTKSTKPSRQLPEGISKQSSPIKEFVPITENLAWALGLWFAEGSHCTSSEGILNGIKITMNINELPYLAKFAEIMLVSFGVRSTISKHSRHGSTPTWAVCTIHNSVISEAFFKEFGRGAKSKNLAPWMKTLPKGSLRAIVDGVYIGDGKKVTRNSTYITLTNPKLVMSLYEIGLKAGMQIGLQMQEKAGKNTTIKYVQRLNLYNYKLGTSPHSIHSIPFEDGLRYCPFTLQKLNTNEIVYDITVEKDHSFSTAGVVVHNCSGTYLGDSIRSWGVARMEIEQLTQRGYGTSTVLDTVRPRGSAISRGGKSSGIMHPADDLVNSMKKISQGSSRRGNIGQYLNPLHEDFDELVDQLLSDDDTWNIGWNITDEFEELFKKDPDRADHIWKRMLRLKLLKGKGYFFFLDKVNRSSPQMYKDRGFKVKGSNLCSEIQLMADENHSFTCVLSSMNITKFDEWVDTKAVEISTVFLDAIISDMLIKAKEEQGFERIIAFTEKSRAIGLGILGEASYYQQQSWVFGDIPSSIFNKQLVELLDTRTLYVSKWLATAVGEPKWLKGYGLRFSHRLSFPPTKSTAEIQGGPSEGEEPVFANVFESDTAGGTVYRINPVFLELMKDRKMYTKSVMERIAEDQGSVQAEDWLTDHEKAVFRTAFEVSQFDVLRMAGDRQVRMNATGGGQGQSTSLYIPADAKEEYISELHHTAFINPNIESLYYIRSLNGATKIKIEPSICASCEG